jgi:hypothetical protein
MERTHRLRVRALRTLVLIAFLTPLTAHAITTNVKVATPDGGDYGEQLIIVDAKTDRVVTQAEPTTKKEDEKDRRRGAFWLLDLGEGIYYAKSPSGARSRTFEVKGPGPVNVDLTLASTLASGAAVGVGFMFDLEGGYGYTSTGYDSGAFIDNIQFMRMDLGAARRNFDIDTHGGYLGARIYPPFDLSVWTGLAIRPFFEVNGQIFGEQTADGAAFGVNGTTAFNSTTTNATWFERQSSIGIGFGTRFGWNCGPVEIGVLPTVNFQWDNGRFRRTWNEQIFLPGNPNAIDTQNMSLTTSSVLLGGNLQLKPCKDCGFYLFGGGGWKQELNGGDASIEGQTFGGFDTASQLSVGGGWQAQAGVGWQFRLGDLGF